MMMFYTYDPQDDCFQKEFTLVSMRQNCSPRRGFDSVSLSRIPSESEHLL